MKKNKQCFSDILKSVMDRKRISVRSLSDMTNKEGLRVPASTISAWRNGAVGSDFHALKIIARCLGVSLSYLLTGEQEDKVEHSKNFEDYFEEGEILFNGYAKVSVQQLIPKKKNKEK